MSFFLGWLNGLFTLCGLDLRFGSVKLSQVRLARSQVRLADSVCRMTRSRCDQGWQHIEPKHHAASRRFLARVNPTALEGDTLRSSLFL